MIKEYGGYMPLELNNGEELFDKYIEAKVARVNCGRNALALATLSVKPKKVFVPYYNCNVVADTLKKYEIPMEYYFLDEKMEPAVDQLGEDEWIVYVNYFGITHQDQIKQIAEKYKRVIFDNTQALFSQPVLDGCCFNVYSPRKFVGLCDGAYLVWSGEHEVSDDFPQDVSWDRASFLFKSIELGTNAAYGDSMQSKVCFDDGIRKMSVLTHKMLKSLNYDEIKQKRARNFNVLKEEFRDLNEFWLPLGEAAPFVYPLFVPKVIRHELVKNKIYVSQWWKYLLDVVPQNSIEANLSNYLLPLPVDQRYSEDDMADMAKIVKRYL